MLATLRSRCVKFNFEHPSFEGFKEILLFQNDKLNLEEISFLFDLSNSSPGLSLELFSNDIKDVYSTLLEILFEQDPLSSKVINLSTAVSSYTNDQFKIYIFIIKFILISIIKIKAGYNFSKSFRSNIFQSLEKISSSFDYLICFEMLEYLNNNENDLFTYNLDKNIFNLNFFTPLSKTTLNNFYITTPIYYVNDKPHIGHAYTTIACDIIARFQKLQNKNVFFLTGTDEHGQKVEKAAISAGEEPQSFVNKMSKNFKNLIPFLGCEVNDFICTTENRHKIAAQYLWNTLKDNNQIYLSHYKGWYSVRDEAFYMENELTKTNGTYFAPSGAPV